MPGSTAQVYQPAFCQQDNIFTINVVKVYLGFDFILGVPVLPVKPGHVYFAPPDYHLLVDCAEDGSPMLALSVDEPVHFSRPSIDVLFESAAECFGEELAGVILTGANDDGVRGLGAVARAGGLTVGQDPAEALAATLPASAVRTGLAQQVLPLAGIRDLFTRVGVAP